MTDTERQLSEHLRKLTAIAEFPNAYSPEVRARWIDEARELLSDIDTKRAGRVYE